MPKNKVFGQAEGGETPDVSIKMPPMNDSMQARLHCITLAAVHKALKDNA